MPSTPQIPGLKDLHLIGEGGFARVYRAQEETFDRQVAVKVLNSAIADADALARFQRECRALGQVDGHPNIVTVHSAGTTVDGHPYLIMAYEPNGSLQDRLDAGLRPEPQQLAKIGAELADALATAHAAEVLHRDVKPANVLLSSREVPKLADFGIARLVGDTSRTKSGSITASIAHAPPEQVEGRPASPASDAYSLGSTLAALALGHAPFMTSENDSLASVLGRLVTADPPDLRLAGQSAELASLVSELMRKDATERPSDLAAIASRLRRMADAAPAPHATEAEVHFAPVPPSLQGYPHTTSPAAGLPMPAPRPPADGGQHSPPPFAGQQPFTGHHAAVAHPAGKPRRTGVLVGSVVGALLLMLAGGFAINSLREQPVEVTVTRPAAPTPTPTTAPTPVPTPSPTDDGGLSQLPTSQPTPSEQITPTAPATTDPLPSADVDPTGDVSSTIFSDPGLLSTALLGENDLPDGEWTLALEEQAAAPIDVNHPVALWDVCGQTLDASQYGAAASNVWIQAADPPIAASSTLVQILLEPATVYEDILAHHQQCDSYFDAQEDGTQLEVNILTVEAVDFEPYGGIIVLQELPELGITYFSSFVVTDDVVIAIEGDQRLSVDEMTQMLAIVALNVTTLDLGPN